MRKLAQQRAGIGQVKQTVADMDHMTQQTAALVEQAAAADSMQQQSRALAQAVSVFRLAEDRPQTGNVGYALDDRPARRVSKLER